MTTDHVPQEGLAVRGGVPVYKGDWPAWPRIGTRGRELLDEVVSSGRWAISGEWMGSEPMNRRFATAFGQYLDVPYVVPVDHGSSALLAALLAVGVRCGQEVIVPGLTWVACASAVLRLGAVPVLVDIDPSTLCLSADSVASAITERTSAIVVVHLYSCMADMDRLRTVAAEHGLPIVEDCAQAHGATWNGQRAGSLGAVGAFSFQQGKSMTCGEGGAVVTKDPVLARRLQQVATDGRLYARRTPALAHPQLEDCGEIQGYNMCLSEFHAAILLDALDRLEPETVQRASFAAALAERLRSVPGISCCTPYPRNTRRAYYHFPVILDEAVLAGATVEDLCAAIEAELNLWVHPMYQPLSHNALLRPEACASMPREVLGQVRTREASLPIARALQRRTILIHHRALLADPTKLEIIEAALRKCLSGVNQIRAGSGGSDDRR